MLISFIYYLHLARSHQRGNPWIFEPGSEVTQKYREEKAISEEILRFTSMALKLHH